MRQLTDNKELRSKYQGKKNKRKKFYGKRREQNEEGVRFEQISLAVETVMSKIPRRGNKNGRDRNGFSHFVFVVGLMYRYNKSQGEVVVLLSRLLPVTDNAIDWRRRNSRYHFELDEQRKVIGEDVRVRATDHLVLRQPFLRQRPEQPERSHRLFCVKNIIDDALKVERVIGKRHDVVAVRRGELKRVRKLVGLITGDDLLEARLVAEILEVFVILRDAAGRQELHDAAVGQRVEVAAQHELDAVRVDVDTAVLRVFERVRGHLEDVLQLLAQHHRLNQLDVAEFRVPVDVRRADEDRLLHVRAVRGRVLPRGLCCFEQRRKADVVLGHDAVQHVLQAVCVRHRELIELHQVFLYQRELARPKKDGAPVDVFPFALGHVLRPRLRRKDAAITVLLQLRQEEVVELIHLDLLQIDDVRAVVPYLLEDALLAVVPVQRPARAVRVHLPRRVLVAQHVVAHHGEDARLPARRWPRERYPRPRGRRGGVHLQVVQHKSQQFLRAVLLAIYRHEIFIQRVACQSEYDEIEQLTKLVWQYPE